MCFSTPSVTCTLLLLPPCRQLLWGGRDVEWKLLHLTHRPRQLGHDPPPVGVEVVHVDPKQMHRAVAAGHQQRLQRATARRGRGAACCEKYRRAVARRIAWNRGGLVNVVRVADERSEIMVKDVNRALLLSLFVATEHHLFTH